MSRPSVSILVAARNEAPNILRCLQALAALQYEGPWEVLVGNDHSEDATADLVQAFAQAHPRFRLVHIGEPWGHARGKANALAQLARQAQGEFLLCTDADVAVPPTWIDAMLEAWRPGMGMVTGFTWVEGETLGARLQALDWTLALSLVKMASDWGIPTTAMGNNMLLWRPAYEAVGGYEALPFSVTEDYALFRAVVDRGYGFGQALHAGVMAHTLPAEGYAALCQQRLRWMHGAMQVPWYLLLGLWVQVAWLPLMALGAWLFPAWALGAWLLKLAVQALLLARTLARLGKLGTLASFWAYEPYALWIYTVATLAYFRARPVVWKGRSYPAGQ
jgi:cellulose synthase/poly-beta-1,6-N-acetylglucosamine synthase-like glycosyltransferase